MRGLRWARNSVHHDWSDALVSTDGFHFPRRFPLVFFEWVWRPSADLPLGRPDARGEAAYTTHLQGHAARVTLRDVGAVFAGVADLLEPPSPVSG